MSQQKHKQQDSTEVCAIMKDFEFDGPLAGTRAFLQPFKRYVQLPCIVTKLQMLMIMLVCLISCTRKMS